MSMYRVEGMARVKWLEHCMCEWCEGHEEFSDIAVRETVEGVSEEEAIDGVLFGLTSRCLEEEEPRVTWLNGPTVCEVDRCQDQLMRAAGYQTLPGMV